MRLSLITVKRRPDSDDISRRETLLEGAELRVGRGSDVDVHLPDIDVAYHHATLAETSAGLQLSAVGGAIITVDGAPVESVILNPGVSCRIGDFEIAGETAPDHADRAVTLQRMEAEQTGGPERPQRVVDVLPSRRRLSWALVIVVLAVFLAWPIATVMQRMAAAPLLVICSSLFPPASPPSVSVVSFASVMSAAHGTVPDSLLP